MSLDKIWELLCDKSQEGLDIYKIAKENNLLEVGENKKMWRVRGGLIQANIAQKIQRNPELAKKFNIDIL